MQKSKSIKIRMSDDELKILRDLQEATRLNASQIIRESIRGQRLEPVQAIPEINRSIYVELSRVSSNLNQIAKVLNSRTQQIKADDLNKLIDALARIGQLTKAAQAAALGLQK